MAIDDFNFDTLATPEFTPEPPVDPPNYGQGISDLEGLDRVDDIDPDAVITDSAPPPPAGQYSLRLKHSDGAAAKKPKRVAGLSLAIR